jgi:hypothetical protein
MTDDAEQGQTVRVTVTVRMPARAVPDAPAPGAAEPTDALRRNEAADDGDANTYDRGFADGAAAGCALGRHLEALRWAEELERWRRLVRWTAAQRDTACGGTRTDE